MARRVFFSFHYGEDLYRSMVVRNSWVTQGKEAAGFIDKAEFEQIKRKGDKAVENWIDNQLLGTSVTVVLIGSETLDRKFVQYEIRKSIDRGNGIIGVKIHRIEDMITKRTSAAGNTRKLITGLSGTQSFVYFDDVAEIYDYKSDNGYYNLGSWIESAAQRAGR